MKIPTNCLLRGMPGTYSRVSAETTWRSQYIDPFGEVITPFISMRADAAALSVQSQIGVSNYLTPGDSQVSRLMPTAGVEYRYPFVSIESWGTQTVQPIGQLIVRPSETNIGKLPNEDAQSLVFDDTNLFKVDKFAGWDRVEGGGRANAGVQYTAQFNRGGYCQHAVRPVLPAVRPNSFADRRHHQYRPRQRPRQAGLRLCGARQFQPNQDLHLHVPLPLRPGRFHACNASKSRRARASTAGTPRSCMATMPRSRSSDSCAARRHPHQRRLQDHRELGGERRRTLRPPGRKVRQTRLGLGYIDDCFIMSLNTSPITPTAAM